MEELDCGKTSNLWVAWKTDEKTTMKSTKKINNKIIHHRFISVHPIRILIAQINSSIIWSEISTMDSLVADNCTSCYQCHLDKSIIQTSSSNLLLKLKLIITVSGYTKTTLFSLQPNLYHKNSCIQNIHH